MFWFGKVNEITIKTRKAEKSKQFLHTFQKRITMFNVRSNSRSSVRHLSQKIVKCTFVAFLSLALLSSQPYNQVLGFKIFGFDLSRLASLRAPPSRPSYQPRPTYQEIPEPPAPQIEPHLNSPEYAYRQPEYNSVYSEQFASPAKEKHDIYNSPVIEPQSYVENQPLDYQYEYGQGEIHSYNAHDNTDQRNRQDIKELPPSPVYVPSQHSNPVYSTAASSTKNNQFVSYQVASHNIQNDNQYAAPTYNQGQLEYSDYQELEIITAPTVKSKASIYGGQNTFDVKVGAGFHTSSR